MTVEPTASHWEPIVPVPEGVALKVPWHRTGKPNTVWKYRDAEGRLLMAAARFDENGGGKTIRPLSYCQGANGQRQWRWEALPSPRPLYGLDRLAAHPDAPVLCVEGEKAADAAQAMFPEHVVVTSPNGARAADKADWSPLRGRKVVFWPDHDAEGAGYAETSAALALKAGAASVAIVDVPKNFPEKWDLADVPPEGWDDTRLRALLDAASPAVPPAEDESALTLRWFDEIAASTDGDDFVEGLLTSGGLSVLYGEPNVGKSFLALDLALHVARGEPWFGLEVERGTVVYAALEGGGAIANRLAAFKRHHGVTDLPFGLITAALDLGEEAAAADALIAAIQAASRVRGMPVRLVIIDTLSRALAGCDENSSQDMGALVATVDRIRKETGVHVMLVHHSGKDASRGARGHSLLRAAIDTEIAVTRDRDSGAITFKVTKQRDLPIAGEKSFKLQVVEVGIDRRGKPATSCVVEAVEACDHSIKNLSDNQRRALEALKNCLAAEGTRIRGNPDVPSNVPVVKLDQWRERLKREGVTSADNRDTERKQFQRHQESLANKGLIRMFDGSVWLVGQRGTVRDIGTNVPPGTGTDRDTPLKGCPAVPLSRSPDATDDWSEDL